MALRPFTRHTVRKKESKPPAQRLSLRSRGGTSDKQQIARPDHIQNMRRPSTTSTYRVEGAPAGGNSNVASTESALGAADVLIAIHSNAPD